MNGAALIVGIGGAMIVMAAALVDVMMVCVRCDASAGVIGNVLLGRGEMLKMDRNQWRNTGQLGDQEQAQKPASEAALDVQRNHSIGPIRHQEYQRTRPRWLRKGHINRQFATELGREALPSGTKSFTGTRPQTCGVGAADPMGGGERVHRGASDSSPTRATLR